MSKRGISTGKGFIVSVPYADHATEADHATSAGSATLAGMATNDIGGNNIENTYAKQNGSYANMAVGSATKALKDSDENVIKDTYAKQNGTYANMTVGNATNATNISISQISCTEGSGNTSIVPDSDLSTGLYVLIYTKQEEFVENMTYYQVPCFFVRGRTNSVQITANGVDWLFKRNIISTVDGETFYNPILYKIG